jgi:Lon protease-like protein
MRLPYFPIHAVLYPHLPMPLQLFEPRYVAMARDLLRDESPWNGRFIVSMIRRGREVGDVDVVGCPVGTIAEVRSAEQTADGRFVLLVVGMARAALGTVDRSGPYALVEAAPLDEPRGHGSQALVASVQAALDRYMETVKRFVAAAASVGRSSPEITTVAASLDEVLKPIRLPVDPVAASYAVAGVLQVELTHKQQLLEIPDAASRLRAELTLLSRESRLLADGAMPPVSASELRFSRN